MKLPLVLTAAFVLSLGAGTTSGQFLNKLKQKADQAIDKKLGINQPSTSTGAGTGTAGGSGGNGGSNGGPSNNSGGGLISTPPDVKQNLTDAEGSYSKSNYGQARSSVQQAMLGVELEIGNKILTSLPASIAGLDKIDKDDQVASSGSGWAGLVIVRKYSGGKNKQFTVTIANNAAWMSAITMFMSNGAYASQTGGQQQQNWKQTTLKGNNGIIQFDKSSGYKLSVPIGQSTLMVFEGINFATEVDMMSAAGEPDIDGIKKLLGEN
jgi:hypothetical protein